MKRYFKQLNWKWLDFTSKIHGELYVKRLQFNMGWTFLRYAMLAFINKLAIMDGREVRNRRGDKYYQIEITYLPLSDKHKYE